MGRSKVITQRQPDDVTCGPTALKHALSALGKRYSVETLVDICKTNRNGTSTKNMIRAVQKLGLATLTVEYATLHHLQSALRNSQHATRAILVTYLYDKQAEKNIPHPDSGHWAMVSAYSASKSRIILLDSNTGKKKSYGWADFRQRWMDYDLARVRVHTPTSGKKFRLVKKWQRQLMVVIAREPKHLPKFSIETARVHH